METNGKCVDKPHITKHYRLLDGKVYYKCSTNKREAYGDTPIEAYEMWEQISSVKEWKAQGYRLHTSDQQISVGTHRHEDIKPFSALRYVETSYSNSSVPLRRLE